MNNRFLSKSILFAYAVALSLGTHFVSTGIDRVFDILVHISFHCPGAYLGSVVCALAGLVLIGCGRGLYQVYLHAIEDQMHDANCTIREIHALPRICDSFVGITLILLVMVGTLGYRFLHLFDSEAVLVTHDPFKLFFGPTVLGIYGLCLVYRSNKDRKSISGKVVRSMTLHLPSDKKKHEQSIRDYRRKIILRNIMWNLVLGFSVYAVVFGFVTFITKEINSLIACGITLLLIPITLESAIHLSDETDLKRWFKK